MRYRLTKGIKTALWVLFLVVISNNSTVLAGELILSMFEDDGDEIYTFIAITNTRTEKVTITFHLLKRLPSTSGISEWQDSITELVISLDGHNSAQLWSVTGYEKAGLPSVSLPFDIKLANTLNTKGVVRLECTYSGHWNAATECHDDLHVVAYVMRFGVRDGITTITGYPLRVGSTTSPSPLR